MNYKEFIDNILATRGRFACGDEYKERHHIVPRCMGGTDDKDNLIDLYAREHFEAHRLLALENPNERGLTYAWWAMAHLKDKNQDRVKISAEEYEEVKKNYSKMLSKQNTGSGNPMFGVHRFGKYNPMYGKHLSDEAKEKLSNSKKGKPSWNKGKQLSESTKEKLRIANIGKRHSEESKKKMSESRKGERNWNYGKHLSKETKRKISEVNSGEKHFLYGKHHSEETKRKISKGNKGKKISKEQIEKISKPVQCIETNKIYTSIKDAQNKTRIGNSSIAKCCKGKYKTAGGFTWKYLYDQTKKDGTVIQGAISLGLITEEEALRQLEEQNEKERFDMANWYNTYFRTEDKEIADLIEEGQTIDFDYNEESGDGCCSLRWGLNAIDMEAIELIAKDNHSTFLIRSSDVLTGATHTWVYENGEEKVAEVTESEVVYKDVD